MKIGLIWDLDGTLWDSGEWVSVSWNQYCEARGIARRFTPADCRSYCGKTLEQIAEIVFPELPPDKRNRIIVGCCDAECVVLAEHGGQLYPELLPTLESLHMRYHMSVVSNCGLGYIESFYAGNHTRAYFDDEENAARTGLGKAENIALVMRRNGLRRAVYIGDTEGDYQAARKADGLLRAEDSDACVAFIHAAYGFGQAPEARWRVRSVAELPACIREITAHW